jgi:hypothetical protein
MPHYWHDWEGAMSLAAGRSCAHILGRTPPWDPRCSPPASPLAGFRRIHQEVRLIFCLSGSGSPRSEPAGALGTARPSSRLVGLGRLVGLY